MRFAPTAVLLLLCLSGAPSGATAAETPLPGAIAAPGETTVLSVSAEGAQIYDCKAGPDGKLAWVFREPIAILMMDGKTIGRHYAGPTWEDNDGSVVTGKVAGSLPGRNESDIPWLKLDVTAHRGNGILSDVTTVQRINTVGGRLNGPCDKAGSIGAMPYSADYVFLRKG